MHTSTRIAAGDFRFWQQMAEGAQEVGFATFSPEYHKQDRVGVVSLTLEDGVLQTSFALLALTTAFYDQMRARYVDNDFFDYPQHFAFVGAEGEALFAGKERLALATPQVWNAWSWLDVWPDAKWVTAPATTAGMLQRVFDYQINRLFWPRSLRPSAQETQPPDYLWKMLKSSLKAVYLYGDPDEATSRGNAGLEGERLEIRIGSAAAELVRESVAQLPAMIPVSEAEKAGQKAQVYESVDVGEFLTAMRVDNSN